MKKPTGLVDEPIGTSPWKSWSVNASSNRAKSSNENVPAPMPVRVTAKPVDAEGRKRAGLVGAFFSRSSENNTLTWRQPTESSTTVRSNMRLPFLSSYPRVFPEPVPRNQKLNPSEADQSCAAVSLLNPNQSPDVGLPETVAVSTELPAAEPGTVDPSSWSAPV